MEMKCEREAMETEQEEDSVQTIAFTAGTILVMLGLKRFLVEQWRAWVFLILNLILLAILFMSMRPSCWVMSTGREGDGQIGKTKKKSACGCPQEAEEEGEKECYKEQYRSTDVSNEENEKEEEEEEEEEAEEEEEEEQVSKEELNERVEAFIAMFRQHLVSDAKQAENFRFQKQSSMTPRGFNYSSVLL